MCWKRKRGCGGGPKKPSLPIKKLPGRRLSKGGIDRREKTRSWFEGLWKYILGGVNFSRRGGNTFTKGWGENSTKKKKQTLSKGLNKRRKKGGS